MVELAGIIILGILAQWVAWRAKVPAILPLLIIGFFLSLVFGHAILAGYQDFTVWLSGALLML